MRRLPRCGESVLQTRWKGVCARRELLETIEAPASVDQILIGSFAHGFGWLFFWLLLQTKVKEVRRVVAALAR